LLGRRSGDRFTVEGCKGKAMQVEIIAVTYQPETAGRRLQSA
jgi:transcription elongation GreA/GreB family factor